MVTSCFAQWRIQESEWEGQHKKQIEEEMEVARLKEEAEREKLISADQPTIGDDAAPTAEPSTSTDNNTNTTPGAPEPGTKDTSTSLKLPPEDCLAVEQIEVTLVCGRGEVETGRLLVPTNTPPGRYVLEIVDGVLPACLRNEDSGGLGSVFGAKTAALEDTRYMAQLVRKVKSNHQIMFTVVDPTAPLPAT
jgi:hypothetical protein